MGSTNAQAAALRRRGQLFAPALVLTGHQSAGRGRGANAWWSASGCITATFVVAATSALAPHQLPLVAGLAARDAAAQITGDDAILLKWPNDLLHGRRKLAGLLCQRIDKVDLIGIGLNVNLKIAGAPAGLRESMTSLSEISGRNFDMTDALIALAGHLHATLLRGQERPFAQFLRDYQAHDALLGKRVTVADSTAAVGGSLVSGRCEGIDAVGRLLLRDGERLHRIIAGQITSFA